MKTRSCNENSVRPSVRETRELWQNSRKICLDFYTIWKVIYPSFLRKKSLVGATPSTWNFGSTGPRWSEIDDFQPIIACSATAPPSEKSSIITNRKSPTRFPTSLRWSLYVAPKSPQRGCSKTQNGSFRSKFAFLLRKVCYKVSLCENYQWVVGHSLA